MSTQLLRLIFVYVTENTRRILSLKSLPRNTFCGSFRVGSVDYLVDHSVGRFAENFKVAAVPIAPVEGAFCRSFGEIYKFGSGT